MAKKRKKQNKSQPEQKTELPQESRSTESLTIFWMLCNFATLVAVLLFCAIRVYRVWMIRAESSPVDGFTALIIFVAIIVGSVGLALTPIVLKVRETKPPLPVTIGAVVIGMTPWLIFIVSSIYLAS